LLRGVGWSVAIVLVFFAAVGALTWPLRSLLIGGVVAAPAGCLVKVMQASPGDDPPRLPHPAVVVLWTGLAPAAVSGMIVLGLGPVAVVAGWLSPVLALLWLAGSSAWAHPQGKTDGRPCDDGTLRDLLSALSLDVLCDEWRAACRRADPDEVVCRDQMRRLILAELQRRNPVGTARWLAEAPGDLPHRYVRESQDRDA
jgi:hypothetical protein